MSETKQPIEGQDENVGEDVAALADEMGAGKDQQAEDKMAELEAAAEADLDPEGSKTDPADDEPPDPDSEDLAGDAMAAQAEDAEKVADEGMDPAEETETGAEEAEIGRGAVDEPEAQPALGAGIPLYKCHKTVQAFKITAMDSMANGRICLVGNHARCEVIVEADYVDKHHPQIGGYYVRYHDGYQSWSPADAFEDGYDLI